VGINNNINLSKELWFRVLHAAVGSVVPIEEYNKDLKIAMSDISIVQKLSSLKK